jgi:hypothetical protein
MIDSRIDADASKSPFQSFAAAFAIVAPVFYTICEMRNWPLFTFIPATDSLYMGFYAPARDQGPPMYWYGWIAASFIVSGVVCSITFLLPPVMLRRIPWALTWMAPLLMVPTLIYALKFFWRW